MKQYLLAMICTVFSVTAVYANEEAARLAGLSKSKFMKEFEVFFPEMIATQKQLFVRFDPDLAETAILTGPVTDAEMDAMSCMWDRMDASDELLGLATQMTIGYKLKDMMDADPNLDIVNLFMNEEIVNQQVQDVPDSVLSVQNECGMITATQERLNFTQEVFIKMGMAAEERGYTN